MVRLGIFTKPIHVEKIVNYLNQFTDIDYVISTEKPEINAFDFDIGISYCFPYIIDVERVYGLSKSKIQWYNYHPAPLPSRYKGIQNYSFAIKDKVKEFGVTLHKMTNQVDEGETVKVKMFKLESEPVNSNELGTITHYHLFQLFKETIGELPK